MFKIIIKRYKIFYLRINLVNDFCIKSTIYFGKYKIKVIYYRDDFIIYDDILNLDDSETERLNNELYDIFDFIIKTEKEKMEEQELFEKTVKAMDNYIKAIEIDLPDFASYYYSRFKELYNNIEQKGLKEEFDEFALII